MPWRCGGFVTGKSESALFCNQPSVSHGNGTGNPLLLTAMWWHFVNEFYKSTQLASRDIHISSGETFDVVPTQQPTPVALSLVDTDTASGNNMVSDIAAVADIAPARDMAPQSPQICEDTSPFLNRLSKEGRSAFAIWDKFSGFSVFSENFEQITGLPGSLMMGDQWVMALDATNQYQVHRMLEIAAEEGLSSQILVGTVAHAHCPTRHLIMNITPANEQDGRVMALFYDVTVQKQLEEALTKAEISLKKANRSRSAFLSCLSHELRTPLNAIMGFSEMMREGVLGELSHPKYTEYAEHIHSSGSELLGKISNLLDIAALDSGGMAPSFATCSLRDTLVQLREMHTHAAFAKHITISVDAPDHCTLYADKRMLLSALSHLVTNALAHARAKSTLHISAKLQPNDGVIIAVRDKGTGMMPARLSAIREALREEATYFKIDGEGIGLGLSMAKELIARHGGVLSLDSMPNHGTIACCHLPEECIRHAPQLVAASASASNQH